MRSRSVFLLRWVILALLMALPGCSIPLEPATSAPFTADSDRSTLAGAAGPTTSAGGTILKGARYPLQLGNRWLYRGESRTQFIQNGEPSGPSAEYSWWVDRKSMCVEQRAGAEYMVERSIQYAQGFESQSWIRYRQDLGGLYELDDTSSEPPACLGAYPAGPPPAGGRTAGAISPPAPVLSGRSPSEQAAYGVAIARLGERVAAVHALLRTGSPLPLTLRPPGSARPGELTRLRYPLRFKSRWAIRPDASLVAEVVGFDALDLPAGRLTGCRIRVRSTLFGPADVVHTWYGSAGYLQLVAHLEVDAVDQNGSLVGRVALDERERLMALQVASSRPPLP